MAFFTPDFSDATLRSTWAAHSKELRTKELQHCNDLLYEVIKNDIFARREEIYQDLMTVVSTSPTSSGLSIPLWSYSTAHYSDYRSVVGTPDFYRMEAMLLRNGYKWFVGLVPTDFDVSSFRYDDEGWDSLWRWRQPRSVDEVMRYTDLTKRLTLLFGDAHFRITVCPVAETVLSDPLKVTVTTIQVRLHYHPRGVYPWLRSALDRTKATYADSVPRHLGLALRPFVWTGVVEPRVTPPRRRAPVDPPPQVRRSNSGGLREAVRTLSFEDVSERTESPCYCGHHHAEEE